MADEVEVFDLSDIGERAFKTGLEVFVVGLPVMAILDVEQAALVAAAVSAGSAGASIILNAVLQYARSKRSKVQL